MFLIGDEGDVSELVTEVMKIFGRIAIEEADKSVAKLLQDKITWKWQNEDEEYNSFDYMANYAIEQAYQTFKYGGCQVFTYYNQMKGTCVVSFSTMKEILSDGSAHPLIRIDIEDSIYTG